MKRLGLLHLVATLCFCSCVGIELKDNERISFEFTVADESGNPLEGITVDVIARRDNFQMVELGGGITNAQGYLELVSLSPENETVIEAHINSTEEDFNQAAVNPAFNTAKVLLPSSIFGLEYTVPEIQLGVPATFTLNIVRGSSTDIIQYEVVSIPQQTVVDLNETGVPESDMLTGIFDLTDNEQSRVFPTLLNTEVALIIARFDQNNTFLENETIAIPVTSSNQEFTYAL